MPREGKSHPDHLEVMVAKPVERIVTLVPNATEIVCAIGLGDRLVGRSHECDHPAWVQRLPAVTSSKIESAKPSAEIDRDVKRLLSNALSLYDVDRERLAMLKPDLVVTQDQCEVCAVSRADVEKALAETTGTDTHLLSLAPAQLSDVWNDIRRVGEAAAAPNAAADLAAVLEERISRIVEKSRNLERRSLGALEWLEPLMAAGNWVPELIGIAGGTDPFGTPGQHAPWLDWKTLAREDPEILVTMPCGFGIDRTRREMPALTIRPEWPKLRAVREGRVYITDGNQFFNCPGPRLVESAEVLAEIIHPDTFHFGHEGRGWVRWTKRP